MCANRSVNTKSVPDLRLADLIKYLRRFFIYLEIVKSCLEDRNFNIYIIKTINDWRRKALQFMFN